MLRTKFRYVLFSIFTAVSFIFAPQAFALFDDLQVIDQKTNEPIQNAYLIRIWKRDIPYIADVITRINDVTVSISDKDGRIDQPLGNCFHLSIPLLYDQYEEGSIVYKPGYETLLFSEDRIIKLSRVSTHYEVRRNQIEEFNFDFNLPEIQDCLGKEYELLEVLEKEQQVLFISDSCGSSIHSTTFTPRECDPRDIKDKFKDNPDQRISFLVNIYYTDNCLSCDAVNYLGLTDHPSAVQPLLKILVEEKKSKKEYESRHPVLICNNVISALAKLKPYSLKPVMKLLEHDDCQIREAGINVIREMRAVEAIPALINIFGGECKSISGSAANTLAAMGSEAVVPLIVTLKNEDLAKQFHAINALAKIRDDRAVDPLIKKLQAENPKIRQATAKALGDFKDASIPKSLINAYEIETDNKTRFVIVRSLTRFSEPKAVPIFVSSYIKDKHEYDFLETDIIQSGSASVAPLMDAYDNTSEDTKKEILKLLGEIKDLTALSLLLGEMTNPDPDISRNAIIAVGKIGHPRSIEPLLNLLKSDKLNKRENAVGAMEELGESAIDSMLELLHHEDPYCRWRAAWMLGRVKCRKADKVIDALIHALNDPAYEVRWVSIEALGRIKDVRAVNPIKQMLTIEDEGLRSMAEKSLRQMTGKK